ncbi:MAG: hypothetical protein ACKERF_01385 [Candidatus Hodgkinia cicadicola]
MRWWNCSYREGRHFALRPKLWRGMVRWRKFTAEVTHSEVLFGLRS